MAVLLRELVQTHITPAPGPVVLIAGIIQMIAGGMRDGQWFRAVSPSVVHGVLAGIGNSIEANQLHVMMDSKPLGNGLKNLMLFPERIVLEFEVLVHLPVF